MRLLPTAFALLVAFIATHAHAQRVEHVVEEGEYLGLIAERYGVRVADLVRWNELPTDRLAIGQHLVVSPEAAPDPGQPLGEWSTTYVVRRGDHLTRIATLVGTSVEALREANPDLDPDHLRPGQELRVVGGRRVVDHVTRRGETLGRICARYEVRHLDLLEWNPGLRRRPLEVGMTLRIYTDVRISRSESVGAPNGGSLVDGTRLPAHRAYVVRDDGRAYATSETVQWIVEAFEVALDADPAMPRVRIHDLSVPGGGPLAGHRSHQSGRDADIAYYRRQCAAEQTCFMSRTRPEDLDVAHQYRLFRYWLEHGLVSNIFVDYALEEPLYRYAEEHGATPAQLRAWFQYPNGPDQRTGIIRHVAGHDDHFHVRFVCPRGDDACTEAAVRGRRDDSCAHEHDDPPAAERPTPTSPARAAASTPRPTPDDVPARPEPARAARTATDTIEEDEPNEAAAATPEAPDEGQSPDAPPPPRFEHPATPDGGALSASRADSG